MSNEEHVADSDVLQVYELGFHLLPTVAEENVEEQFQLIKKAIEKNGGAFIDEQAPSLIDLAYTMDKRQERGHERYDNAYFGWVKFETPPDALVELKEDLEEITSILRTLLIKASRENTVIGPMVLKKEAERKAEELEAQSTKVTEEKEDGTITSVKEEKPVEPTEVSEADIDKGIDELIGDGAEAPEDNSSEEPSQDKVE